MNALMNNQLDSSNEWSNEGSNEWSNEFTALKASKTGTVTVRAGGRQGRSHESPPPSPPNTHEILTRARDHSRETSVD